MSELRGKKGFFGYEPALEPEVFEFQRASYPERDPDIIADLWRWMFLRSAERLGIDPRVWLYRKQDQIVAHQGVMPVRLSVDGDEVTTGWFVETMAAESVRGTPIGPMLIKKATEDMPLALSLGQTEQMRQLQYAMGWQRVGALTKYVLVSGLRMNLRHKLPPGLAELAAAVLGIRGRFDWKRRLRKARERFSAGEVTAFGSEHDALWARMARTCRCAAVRDASYLNWKYLARPGRGFGCIEIREGGVLRGVVVTRLCAANQVYPYPRGVLVDVLVALDDDASLSALLAFAVERLSASGAQTVICQASNDRLEAALARAGFVARNERHQFLVSMPGAGDQQVLLDASNWLLTLGDSDADSYPD